MQNGSLRPREAVLPNANIQNDPLILHELVKSGDDKKLSKILQTGVDITVKEPKHGNTPLHEAAWRGYSRCVNLLCALPKPLKTEKETKESSKLKAVVKDTKFFLHIALLSTRNNGGFSALHLAAQNGHNQSCREILLAGADPNVQNNYGDTPLHTACRYGHAGATRILLSGKSDPHIVNLNGDTPLHIAVAMGRRKLTKILLQAGSLQTIKNAQDETVRDIAIRKSLVEVIEILNTPIEIIQRERDRSLNNSSKNENEIKTTPKDKQNQSNEKKKCKFKETTKNLATWSPYGCHYSPDPRDFPSPKLETLPTEPLSKGEQYYLDLAGNIRKGPIGVGNTCYCAPFFRHLEERISKNKKCIKKYVDRATEKLDNKVTALALKTDDQIEELTRSIVSHRKESKEYHHRLEGCIKRGLKERKSTACIKKEKHSEPEKKKISRCKSLDFLECDSIDTKSIQTPNLLSKSVEILDKNDIIIHSNPIGYSEHEEDHSSKHSKSKSYSDASHQQYIDHPKKTSQGLNDILRVNHRKSSISTLSSAEKNAIRRKSMIESPSTGNRSHSSNYDFEDTSYIAKEMNKITSSLLGINIPCDKKQKSIHFNTRTLNQSTKRIDENKSESNTLLTTFYQNNNFEGGDEGVENEIEDEEEENCEDDEEYEDMEEEDEDEDGEIKEESEMFSSSPANTIKTQSSYIRRCIESVMHLKNDQQSTVSQNPDEGQLNKQNEEPRSAIDQIQQTSSTKYEIRNSEIRPLKSACYSQMIQTTFPPDFDNSTVNDYGSDISSNDDLNSYQITPVVPYFSYPNHQTYENIRQQNPYNQNVRYDPSVHDHLKPKDAYYHDLTQRNLSTNKDNYIAISSRNRKPLPLNFDEKNILPNESELYLPLATSNVLPHRNYNETLEIDVTNNNSYIPIRSEILNIDQIQIERDQHNDSGYSTKIWGSSNGASPSMSGQIDLIGNNEANDKGKISETWNSSNLRTSSLV